jgi:hypothetical protein
MGIQTVLNIYKKYEYNFLFFSVDQGRIKKIVKFLNETILDPDIIAIAYYSELMDVYKNVI